MSECCWDYGPHRFAGFRLATDLQFMKYALSAKCKKGKHNKTRYSCKWACERLTYISFFNNFSAFCSFIQFLTKKSISNTKLLTFMHLFDFFPLHLIVSCYVSYNFQK